MPSVFVIAAVLLLAAGTACGGDANDFTVVLLPDTQNYAEKFPETYLEQTAWISSRAQGDNIRFVIHLGDIVQTAEKVKEWQVADRAQKQLEGVVPYSLTVGNHDMKHEGDRVTRGTSMYNRYFPPSRFEKYAWYGGHMGTDNVNNFCFFEGGGMKFMVLSLEFAPGDQTLVWADEVVAAHRDRRVIVATHYYLRTEGRTKDVKPYGLDGAGPDELWQRFVRKHANIFMVVCGHVVGVHHQSSVNDAGDTVHEILCDYQGEANGGDGWLQTLRFVPKEDKIYVDAYSPKLNKYNTAPAHTYLLSYEMPNE